MSKVDAQEAKDRQQILDGAKYLMTRCQEDFDAPIDALLSMVLTISAFAHGVGMPLAELQEGIALSYADMENASSEVKKHAH
jgi:hypothetical protein